MIVTQASLIYKVLVGEHQGRTCVIRTNDSDNPGMAVVRFLDDDSIPTMMKKGNLAQLDLPGWGLLGFPKQTYTLAEYFNQHKGDGSNTVRMSQFSQPRALFFKDILATGETVKGSRKGWDESVLVRLDQSGWVEVASRLPIALQGNENFKLPIELKKGDRLATGCRVVEDAYSAVVNWTTITLDYFENVIPVPSPLPLALM